MGCALRVCCNFLGNSHVFWALNYIPCKAIGEKKDKNLWCHKSWFLDMCQGNRGYSQKNHRDRDSNIQDKEALVQPKLMARLYCQQSNIAVCKKYRLYNLSPTKCTQQRIMESSIFPHIQFASFGIYFLSNKNLYTMSKKNRANTTLPTSPKIPNLVK